MDLHSKELSYLQVPRSELY